MTYEELLQKQPPTTAAGNRAAATRFVEDITGYIQGVGVTNLDPSRRNYLYKLRTKWELRAAGKDESWNVYGGRPGRRPKQSANERRSSQALDPTVYGTEDEVDPLLASIMRKYGTPKERK